MLPLPCPKCQKQHPMGSVLEEIIVGEEIKCGLIVSDSVADVVMSSL